MSTHIFYNSILIHYYSVLNTIYIIRLNSKVYINNNTVHYCLLIIYFTFSPNSKYKEKVLLPSTFSNLRCYWKYSFWCYLNPKSDIYVMCVCVYARVFVDVYRARTHIKGPISMRFCI